MSRPAGPTPDSAGGRADAPVTVDLRSSTATVVWTPPPAGDLRSAPPRVVLADRAACGEFAVLQRMLSRLGVPSVRVDVESVTSLRISSPIGGPISLDGRPVDAAVVWARHLSPRAFPGSADSAEGMVRADSWHALIRQLAGLAPVGLPGHAPGRLEQLADAAAAGVRVPRTIVTTDPGAACADLTGRSVVVKVVDEHFVEPAPGLLVGVLPRIVDRREAAGWRPFGFPVIVQEAVEHEAELRVYHLAGAVRAFAVRKSSPDAVWRAASQVEVAAVTPPDAVVRAVRTLADLWGLRYGAFDLLVARGEPVFLEVNPDGDWRWFEARAGGLAVSAQAALMVRALYLAAGGTAAPRAPRDVLSFLLPDL